MAIDSDPSGARETSDGGASRSPRSWKVFARDVLIIILAAVLISFLIKTFLVRSFYIPSASMENTLLINDRILVNELEPRFFPVERGDVIVFSDPGGWLPALQPVEKAPIAVAIESILSFVGLTAPDSNDHLIKRVIGLPGDHVVCCNDFGQISVNDAPLDEPYIELPSGVTKATKEDFDIVVPSGSLWVMGDNRYNSADSAYHHIVNPGSEYVPVNYVVGRALRVSWPAARWIWLDNYPTVFQAAIVGD